MNLHVLAGCRPQPLASYLCALGVMRLLHAQKDRDVRGFWRDDVFHVITRLDREALVAFFLDEYAPTPVTDPWNGGSGFYPKDKAAREQGVEPLLASTHPRFDAYRQALLDGLSRTAHLGERPSKADKTRFLERCRNEWQQEPLQWFRAAVVVTGDGEDYPALLGTGGNDGRLDYCSNFMQRLCELFDMGTGEAAPGSAALLESCLFGDAVGGLESNSIGQFSPGAAGGANATDGFSGDALLNGWRFLLMLEGALTLPVAAVRALETNDMPRGSAPFAMRSTGAGFGTACRGDEDARGEQWMPLWRAPWAWSEVRAVFREGRMQLGGRRAQRATDAALALASRGVARGIDAFQRYAYIERLGQSKLAVPVGRWDVLLHPEVDVVRDILPWVSRLRRASGNESRDPESLRRDVRRIETAILEVARLPSPGHFQELLIALGRTEDGLGRRPKHTAAAGLRPLPNLRPEWLHHAQDGSPELQLASALASQRWVRRHVLSLAKNKKHFVFVDQSDAAVVWSGRNLVSDLLAVLQRRLVDIKRDGSGWPSPRGTASLDAIMAFVNAQTDDVRIADLARPLMAVQRFEPVRDTAPCDVLPAWALMRLAYLPSDWRIGDRAPVVDPAPLKLLDAGRLAEATELASRRLIAGGIGRMHLERAFGSPELARRVGASLAFPISKRRLDDLVRTVARPVPKE